MSRLFNIIKNEKGAILPIVILMMVVIFTISSSVLLLSRNNNISVNIENDLNKALYIAEAGIERTIYELNNDADDDWSNASPPSSLFTNESIQYSAGGISFSGTYTIILSDRSIDDLEITSTGKVNNSEKKIIVRVTK